jgi:hypothetical protein
MQCVRSIAQEQWWLCWISEILRNDLFDPNCQHLYVVCLAGANEGLKTVNITICVLNNFTRSLPRISRMHPDFSKRGKKRWISLPVYWNFEVIFLRRTGGPMLLPRYIRISRLYVCVEQAAQCYNVQAYWNFDVKVLRFCVEQQAAECI